MAVEDLLRRISAYFTIVVKSENGNNSTIKDTFCTGLIVGAYCEHPTDGCTDYDNSVVLFYSIEEDIKDPFQVYFRGGDVRKFTIVDRKGNFVWARLYEANPSRRFQFQKGSHIWRSNDLTTPQEDDLVIGMPPCIDDNNFSKPEESVLISPVLAVEKKGMQSKYITFATKRDFLVTGEAFDSLHRSSDQISEPMGFVNPEPKVNIEKTIGRLYQGPFIFNSEGKPFAVLNSVENVVFMEDPSNIKITGKFQLLPATFSLKLTSAHE